MRFIMLLMVLLALGSAWANNLRIVQAKDGKTITLQNLAKNLSKCDIIFFGEFHDNAAIHQMQKELLPLLGGKRELMLSFEMFERDVQGFLTDYIEGKIEEAEFVANSRPWGNYETDYRPLVEYAKANKLQAIAANVPRVYAGKLARQGTAFIDELDATERAYLAAILTSPEDDYQQAFYALMGAQSSPMHAMNTDLLPLYQAQCLKDDTMAESIVKALQKKPKAQLIHFNGAFHSNAFLGTVSRVKTALPKHKIAVVSPIYSQDWQNIKLNGEDKQAGTYIIYLPEPEAGGEE